MAEIGTPENPEIIEPGQRPPPRRDAGAGAGPGTPRSAPQRLPRSMVFTLLRVLFAITLPVAGFDLVYGWIAHTALNYGGVLPWLGVVMLSPLALLLNLVGVAAHLLLWPVIFLTLSGRATSNPLHDQRFARFKFINVQSKGNS